MTTVWTQSVKPAPSQQRSGENHGHCGHCSLCWFRIKQHLGSELSLWHIKEWWSELQLDWQWLLRKDKDIVSWAHPFPLRAHVYKYLFSKLVQSLLYGCIKWTNLVLHPPRECLFLLLEYWFFIRFVNDRNFHYFGKLWLKFSLSQSRGEMHLPSRDTMSCIDMVFIQALISSHYKITAF